ncbi:MAG: ABC transporter related protein, partial [Thermovirga lienii]
MEQQKTLLKLEKVRKIYKMGEVEVEALKPSSLEVYEGELLVILGPSGSGKSTLLNIMGGMDSPTEGAVWFGGEDLARASERRLTEYRRHQVGFVFQFYNLIPDLTALENV